jgi:hypothetical protein
MLDDQTVRGFLKDLSEFCWNDCKHFNRNAMVPCHQERCLFFSIRHRAMETHLQNLVIRDFLAQKKSS